MTALIRAASIDDMLAGFDSLEQYTASRELAPDQRIALTVAKALIAAYAGLVRPLRRGPFRRLLGDLAALRDIRIDLPDAPPPSPDTHYLGRAERMAFARNGMLQPFEVVSPTEAADLARLSRDAFARSFDGKLVFDDAVADALRRHDQWSINYAGLFQGQHLAPLRALLRRPAIAHRLASLLGPDVICWRTQFFEKRPGDGGTFWHQNSAFKESSRARKLSPTEPFSPPTIQLTVWVALTDVTIANGAMRMMPGTFTDGRLERVYEYGAAHGIDLASRIPATRRDTFLRAALFSSGNFRAAQAVFDQVQHLFQLHDAWADKEVHDLVMPAGHAVIFSSLNMHASYGNTTEDDTRLAFVGRCCANSVRVYDGMEEDVIPTPEGPKAFPTSRTACIQLHGEDRYGHNRMLAE